METDDLAGRLSAALNARPFMGNKRAAYRDAGVSPQTFDRALEGLPVRADKRAELEDFIARNAEALDPHAPDPEKVSPLATIADLHDLRREVFARIQELEDEVAAARLSRAPGGGADSNVSQLPSAEALDPTIPDDVAARSQPGKGRAQAEREQQDEEGEQ